MSAISDVSSSLKYQKAEEPAKIRSFCNWVKDNKKAIAVAFLIVAIAAVTFGIGAIVAAAAGATVTTSIVAGKLVFALGINKSLLVAGIAAFVSGLFATGFSAGYLAK